MAEARGRAEWAQTSNLLLMLYDCHRDPSKTEDRTADFFNPFCRVEEKSKPKPKISIRALKTVFVDRQPLQLADLLEEP